MAKPALWLRKKQRSARALVFLVNMAVLAGISFATIRGLLDAEYFFVHVFFALMGGMLVGLIVQAIRKPFLLKTKRREYLESRPDLPEDIALAILKGRVIQGMNAEMSTIATGTTYREVPNDEDVVRVTSRDAYVKGSKIEI